MSTFLLFIASIFFYAFWYPPYLILLLISVFIDYWACLKIEELGKEKGKAYLWFSVLSNLLILFSFKYLHFAAHIFNINLPENWHWALPLGISFFTFQTMACTVDVYRGEVKAKTNFLDFLFYICFFPQLIAGPILRLKGDWDHLMSISKPTLKSFDSGIYLICWGLIKKMLIADNLAQLVEENFSNPGLLDNPFLAWLGVYAFAVQIYCDFSGYVDVAIGVAKIFGIELPANFNYPYLANSITDFWRRWHITLSLWLRDYLYIPLGGNRKGEMRTKFNLLTTMILGGLWHGANWTFVAWGALHGIILSLEKEFFAKFKVPDLISKVVCFHIVCLSWVFFRAKDISSAFTYIWKLVDFSMVTRLSEYLSAAHVQYLALLVFSLIIHVISYKTQLKDKLASFRPEFKLAFVFVTIVLIMLFGIKQEVRFIYFDF